MISFAIKAFKYSALDYLLKPIDIEELKQAVEKASQTNNENIAEKFTQITYSISSANQKIR